MIVTHCKHLILLLRFSLFHFLLHLLCLLHNSNWLLLLIWFLFGLFFCFLQHGFWCSLAGVVIGYCSLIVIFLFVLHHLLLLILLLIIFIIHWRWDGCLSLILTRVHTIDRNRTSAWLIQVLYATRGKHLRWIWLASVLRIDLISGRERALWTGELRILHSNGR